MCAQPRKPPPWSVPLLIALSIGVFVAALALFGVAAALLFVVGLLLGQFA